MRDYAKLVEWLRADVLCTYEETKHMQGLAADAIQALCRACANYAEQACENETRWIPVTERLPEPCETVIAYRIFGIYGQMSEICLAHTLKIYDKTTWSMVGVTHWMPLPEPPKEEAE